MNSFVVCSVAVLGVQAASGELTSTITVTDLKGTYTIPYIQSSRDYTVVVDFSDPAASAANLDLSANGLHRTQRVEKSAPCAVFTALPPGEYTLKTEWLNVTGEKLSETVVNRIGIGAVLVAIGDSLTEGYNGNGFMRESLELKASDFPVDAVSKDGRNFPQYSPTTWQHKPTVNCFQSWMTSLNDLLAAQWGMPVFIANEGMGGFTSQAYLATMQKNAIWKQRMQQLKPSVWLIHLGVNDERRKVPPEEFSKNMRAIVDILISEYNADPSNIYLAYPSYDYAPSAESVLQSYIAEIDKIIAETGASKGPDFFTAFSKDKEKWYGRDPVHPGLEGINLMAELWTKALAVKSSAFIRELRKGNPQTIVTYGTSLTAGGTWVKELQRELNKKFPGKAVVINSGEGAKCSIWGLENLQQRVLDKKPDVVFIEFSVNDAYRPYKMVPADGKKNLEVMIDRIHASNPSCEIILMVMNPMVGVNAERRPGLEEFNEVYRTVARERGLQLIDHYPIWVEIFNTDRQRFDSMVPDGAHPDAEGCLKVVVPSIFKAIGL
jgi:alpha-L-rhamnosidase